MINLFDDQLTLAELLEIVFTGIPFLIIYVIVGFGPGLILGILIMNFIAGRGNPRFVDVHEESVRKAAEHNAQWNPNHDRWQN